MSCRPVLVSLLSAAALGAAGTTVLFDPLFPSDRFTIADAAQKTGLRVDLPPPDCRLEPSTCAEIAAVNQLDGFSLLPRVRVRFSGPVNPDTLRAGISILWLDDLTNEEYGLQPVGHVTPINQVLYDPATNTAFAKPDEILSQHRRYAVVVTSAVRDRAGDPVEPDPAFRACVTGQASEYCGRLAAALGRMPAVGGSVFTTLSATIWLEKARTAVQDSRLDLQRGASFAVSDLASVTARFQTHTRPPRFDEITLPALVLGGVGRVVFGTFRSPSFLDDRQGIPLVPTTAEVAAPETASEIHFQVYLPPGDPPFPVVIAGHGLGGSRLDFATAIAATMAQAGFATIAINAVGHGGGPEGQIVIVDRSGRRTEVPIGGRSIDVNGDGEFESFEGCGNLGESAGLRDCIRQTALDLAQLVHAIKSTPELDAGRIYYAGASFGAIYGTVFNALDPEVAAAALNVGGAPVADIARLGTSYRGLVVQALAARTPPLLNKGRDYDDAYVLRYRPVRVIDVPGAVEIQEFFERQEWLHMAGDPIAWAPHLKSSTLPGVPIKRVLFQIARGDQTVPNPTSSALIRAANMREMTSYYRHDLARAAAPQLPANPHAFIGNLFSPAGLVIALAAQRQMAEFFAGDGQSVPDVNSSVRLFFGGRNLFEIPAMLPEELNW